MKRMIEKNQLSNSTVKAQFSNFRTNFVDLMTGHSEFKDGDIPLRGPALLSFCTEIFFGFKSWESLKKQSLNSNLKTNDDIYIYDEEHLKATLSKSAAFIKKKFVPYASEKEIESHLVSSTMMMPKNRTRMPHTEKGRKLCYSLCENPLRLTEMKNEVLVSISGKEEKGLLTYFHHVVCPKNGDIQEEQAVIFIKGIGMKNYSFDVVKAAKEFDPFSSYRAFEIFGFQQFINEYSNSKSSVKQDITHHSELIENAKNEGKAVSVVIQHPITKEVHEYPLDDEFELRSLRELYHDTQNLIFIAR